LRGGVGLALGVVAVPYSNTQREQREGNITYLNEEMNAQNLDKHNYTGGLTSNSRMRTQ
jgi:hypothetical protein